MSSNLLSFTPSDFTSLFSILNKTLKSYLINNIFTCELMKVDSVNTDKTVNLKTILQNVDTQGNIIENTEILNNINVLMIKGGNTSISFNNVAGDIGLYLCFKKDFGKYFSNNNTKITNDNIFSFANGVFLPLQLNNITDSLIIKNGGGSIEINDTNITIKGGNITIEGSSVNLGGSGGQGVARIGDSVQVNVTSGSSAGVWTGTITAGSTITTSL